MYEYPVLSYGRAIGENPCFAYLGRVRMGARLTESSWKLDSFRRSLRKRFGGEGAYPNTNTNLIIVKTVLSCCSVKSTEYNGI